MADFLHELTQCEARLHAAEQERDELREREKNDSWYYSRWRHEEKRAAAANQRAEAAEKRCAVLTEAIQQAMALTGTSTAHYHVLATALATTAPAKDEKEIFHGIDS